MKPVNEMKLSFLSRSANESFARAAVSSFVLQLDPTVGELADIKTAVSEAVTNCIVHAYAGTSGVIYITAQIFEKGRFVIKIRDRGCGIEDVKQAMEPLYTTGGEERAGLGFAVMMSFMDKVKVSSRPQMGTVVTMTKCFRKAGSRMADRAAFINENLGLVHACAKRFKGRGIEYDDLYGAGCVGLVKAADNFDTGRGLRFSTYAVPVILGEMRRLFRDGGAVKVSRSLKELSLKATRACEAFAVKHGRDPTISELAESLQVEPELAAEALNAAARPVSLSADEENGGGQLDIPIDAPEEKLTELLSLRQVIGELDERDRALIRPAFF